MPDRVRRMARENVARALRVANHRDAILAAVVATWPVDSRRRTPEEWAALWAAAPRATTRVEARNRTRQVAAHAAERGALPTSITQAEAPPRMSATALLCASDRQQFELTAPGPTTGGAPALLRLLLPTTQRPASYRDWAWVAASVRVPDHVPAHVVCAAPSLRVVAGRVRVDLPWTVAVAPTAPTGHVRALGLDWGVNTLLTGAAARLATERDGRARVVATGRPLALDATGISAKLIRLRTGREQMAARLARYEALLAGAPDQLALLGKQGTLEAEHGRLRARARNLGRALGWSAARWAVDQALANRCSVIYVEDLTTMETRGLGRTMNRRLGTAVRSTVFEALAHTAAKAGIAVVTVPARGTSAGCPRCGGKVRHAKSPDRPTTPGHKWSVCACGLSCDRDHAAAERIAARGLLGQASATRTRSGALVTRATVDGRVRRTPAARDKTSQTPRRPRRGPRSSSPSPLRRRVPSPAMAGHRPEGRLCSDSGARAPRSQGSTTRAHMRHLPRHRPRGAARGAGFHLHAQATPVSLHFS